ncbi:MAG: PRC-barrel domain-containing protein [Cyanobacteria bacterium P01_D01_bin.73]
MEDDRAIEDGVDVEPYSRVVGSEVITETGEMLGKVRGFKFDVEDGTVTAILVASLGIPQVPEQLISTYELPIDEVVSSGPDRLIVFEGAEDRLVQLSVGVLERMGISSPPWEREDEDLYFTPTAAPSNQLGTGLRQESARSQRMDQGYGEEAWQEEEWSDRQTARQRQPEYYAEDDNWADGREPQRSRQPEYEEAGADAWDDEPDYQAPKLNIPEKTRQPEYEEGGY